jgi:ABC-type antimicrobial peptide transport system permease subunit
MFALILTAFGVYGVLAYTIQQRRREIGIRIALGASAREVARLVVMQGVGPVLAGVFLGVLAALGLSRVVSSFLWGVTPTDPSMLAATGAMLVGVALAASWMPAREAVRLDPVTAINTEP